MPYKILFSILAVFWLVGCFPDDPYDDSNFREKHTQLKFCVNEKGIQAEPEFRVDLSVYGAETITLQRDADGNYCGRLKRLVLFPSSSNIAFRLVPRNNAANLLSWIEVHYPTLNEQGELVAASTRIKRNTAGTLQAVLVVPHESDAVIIAPRMIPDNQTNEFF